MLSSKKCASPLFKLTRWPVGRKVRGQEWVGGGRRKMVEIQYGRRNKNIGNCVLYDVFCGAETAKHTVTCHITHHISLRLAYL